MAYNKNVDITQNNIVVISGSQVRITGSLLSSNASFTTLSASNTNISGNLVIDGPVNLAQFPDYAYVLYTSSFDKIVVYPGLYVSGNLTGSGLGSFQTITGSTGSFTVLTGSTITGSTALFTILTASNISASSNIITAGNLVVNGGQISSSTTTLTVIAGTTVDIKDNTLITGSLSVTNGIFVSGSSIYGQVAELTSSTSNYTLVRQDSGKFLNVNSVSAVTVTVPVGLPTGFTVSLCQLGAGQVTVSGAVGVTINNRQSHRKTAGQYSVVSLVGTSANIYVFVGDTIL